MPSFLKKRNQFCMKKNILSSLFLLGLALSPILVLAQSQYVLEKLGPHINSPEYDEISPVIDIYGKKMYFTRVGYPTFRKNLVEEGEDLSQTMPETNFLTYLKSIFSTISNGHYVQDPISSGYNQDIWVARSIDSFEMSEVTHPQFPLNNALPNSVCALTPSENEVIVLNQFDEEGGMSKGFSIVRQSSDGMWSFPSAIKIKNYRNNGSDVSMTLSQDGEVMILSMSKEDTRGMSDLYISFREGENEWSEPKNLGPKVNSTRKEMTPFLSADKKKLFFSSNRWGSKGGHDLYMIEREDDSWENWSRPRRFVDPINSSAEESQPYFNTSSGYLYFTSTRDGSSDIFRVKIAPERPVGVTLTGTIINSKTGKPVGARILFGPSNSHHKNIFVTDDGTYQITIPQGIEYTIETDVAGYNNTVEKVFYNPSYVYFKKKNLDFNISSMEAGDKVELKAIFFEQSKPIVKEESYPAIRELANFLKDNPHIYIRIEGHTDNQGEIPSLMQLSRERAEAVKNYLVYECLINPVRIETEGYGPNYPLNNNSSDELREANRRVEVTISYISEPTLGLTKKDK